MFYLGNTVLRNQKIYNNASVNVVQLTVGNDSYKNTHCVGEGGSEHTMQAVVRITSGI